MSLRIAIVGAGVTGATIARMLADRGVAVDVFEERDHVAGNCHTVWDDRAACFQHVYGPHIFHTDSDRVLAWIKRFTNLLPYKHSVKAQALGAVYGLPINLHTLNQFFGQTFSPDEARRHLSGLTDKGVDPEESFRTRALSLLGPDIYQAFFESYTRKQWGIEPDQIPASILKRLPIRFNYDDNYFFHAIQGLPEGGYTAMVQNALDHELIHLHLGQSVRFDALRASYDHVFWSGPIEAIFDADEGYLPYRTLDFDTRYVDGDAQGCAVMNYPAADVDFTRCTQHNYFRSSRDTSEISVSLVSYEYSRTWEPGDIQYYPVSLLGENALLKRYQARAAAIDGLHLCGRLGKFAYMDMDVAILDAMTLMDDLFQGALRDVGARD